MAAPAAGLAAPGLLLGAKQPVKPSNIIFMVADGMSPGVLSLAEIGSESARGRGTAWCELLRSPDAVTGLFDQASLNSCITDSAAASSSWGSGVRVVNGAINTLPDGRPLTPIATIASQQGWHVGLVTTTTVTHATPAGFAAAQPNRGTENDIAPQYLKNVDVLMGGGSEFFDPAQREDGRDLVGEYQTAGFHVVRSAAELESAGRRRRLLGLFSENHLPYSIDRHHTGDTSVPSLADSMLAAIQCLESDGGFFLMVEGGRVDHAAHNNDVASLLWEQLDFDDAVRAAVAYARRRGDTLVVLASDHGNANPALNQVGREADRLHRISQAEGSVVTLAARVGRSPSTDQIKELIADFYRTQISDKEADALKAALGGEQGVTINRQFDSPQGALGQCLCNYFGVGWVGKGHTSDHVVSTAFGPGAAAFAGLVRNTRVFEIFTGYMGSDFRNPAMEAAAARLPAHVQIESPHWT